MEIIGIFTIMMLPMIAGGITMLYSYQATKDIGQEITQEHKQ
jgi:hypothetical protein